MADTSTLYDQDFYAWLGNNANLLREGRLDAIDAVHLAEELEDMGRSQKRAIASHRRVLLSHLLKWHYQPDRRSVFWRLSIRNARDQIEAIVDDSPSLRRELPEVLSRAYQKARKYAADETELPLETFPGQMPFSTERVFDDEYLPD
jgi:hypothetical protein